MTDTKRKLDSSTPPTNSTASARAGGALSCQRCRQRKIKCNLVFPCFNCVKTNNECKQVTDDLRKKRHTMDYVKSLEIQINSLECLIGKIKTCDDQVKRDEILRRVTLDEEIWERVDRNDELDLNKDSKLSAHLSIHNIQGDGRDTPTSIGSNPDKNHRDQAERIKFPNMPVEGQPNTSISVYGPTSVYDGTFLAESRVKRPYNSEMNNLNTDPEIQKCIQLFFRWQYPGHNMFIYREAFLVDFFNPTPTSLYCSEELILSISALGARMSDDESTHSKSSFFYNTAKSKLLNKIDYPTIASLQSFLLLAFYDICYGSNSSGWMLAGNAMRMGFDLGFQLNPENWFVKSSESLSPFNVAVRSRIYWGSYMADHFICLLLGRPSTLKFSDASIPETSDLPDLDSINDYSYIDKDGTNKQLVISAPLVNMVNLIKISDQMLNEIFRRHKNQDLNIISRFEKLKEFNLEIINWKRNLPDDLAWSKNDLIRNSSDPTIMSIRYYYYILLLCLNRPFIAIYENENEHGKIYEELTPSKICDEVIGDLYWAIKCFKKDHGLKKASIFIVYCSILSISIILLTKNNHLIQDKKIRLDFFLDVLKDCSYTWKLAEKSHKLISAKIHNTNTTANSNYSSGFTQRNKQRCNTNLHNLSDNVKSDRQNYEVPPLDQTQNLRAFNSATNVPINTQSSASSDNALFASSRAGGTPATTYTTTTQSDVNNYYDDGHSANKNNLNAHPISQLHPNTNFNFNEEIEIDFFGGPPVLMTSDLFNEDWESLFPDYIFNSK